MHDAIHELVEIVGPAHVLTESDAKAAYEVDWTGRFRGATPAVVRPGSVEEVAAVVDVCRRHDVAVVPQGGNTGLVGGSVPLAGELVLSLRRLDRVGPVDTAAQQVSAGAGATIEAVQQAAAAAGLRYPVDFGARGSATVGGSVATNAGGVNVLRFGATREQIVGVEAVFGNGEAIRRMSGLVKDNTGYDLAGLLCGSEGTLGIVTEVRLRLVGAPAQRVTALVAMASVDDAVRAVASWRAGLASLEAAELFFHEGLELVTSAFGLAPPFSTASPVYVLIEACDHRDPTGDVADAIDAVDGVVDVAVATDEASRARLWRFREEHTLAINTLGPPHKFDVTLPVAGLGEFAARVPAVVAAAEPDARVWQFGHVGDGNLHVNVTGVAPDAERLDEAVYGLVVEMGGSISAEHGIGTAKARFLSTDRTPGELAVMRAIKAALDPRSIMNPRAIFDAPAVQRP